MFTEDHQRITKQNKNANGSQKPLKTILINHRKFKKRKNKKLLEITKKRIKQTNESQEREQEIQKKLTRKTRNDSPYHISSEA